MLDQAFARQELPHLILAESVALPDGHNQAAVVPISLALEVVDIQLRHSAVAALRLDHLIHDLIRQRPTLLLTSHSFGTDGLEHSSDSVNFKHLHYGVTESF